LERATRFLRARLAEGALRAGERGEIIGLVDIFGGQIVDVTAEHVTIQVTGETDELVRFEELLRPFGLIEMVKTGVVALSRELVPRSLSGG